LIAGTGFPILPVFPRCASAQLCSRTSPGRGTPAGEPYFAPFTAYYFKTTAYPFPEGCSFAR
jgi:hypothetical protein